MSVEDPSDDFLVRPTAPDRVPSRPKPPLRWEQTGFQWAGGFTLEEIVDTVHHWWIEYRDHHSPRPVEDPGRQSLVSIIFSTPDRVIVPELRRIQAYLQLRSGDRWHIFVAGYREDWRSGTWSEKPVLRFDEQSFDELRRQMPSPWRYSGLCDVVSVMAYSHHPQTIDWESFRSVTITRPDGTYAERSFGEIAELMSDWPDDPDGLADYAPGEPPSIGRLDRQSLEPGLRFLGGAVGGGVLGNFTYDMLKVLF
ncbi:hypothetical protein [Spirillospora sp. NPDC029432]|uniref:hypothetical protein n=1 Tax=Spirillospora sp. NPDC029432 TaxID=3154599 RepID=UPI003455E5FC